MLNVIVEDVLSEAIMQRLLSHVGYTGKATYRVMRGNGQIRLGLPKYVGASRFYPHIVLTDLDQYPCPPELLETWGLGNSPDGMLFRVAVREVESWLIADRESFANYLHVAKGKVPFNPEDVVDPKKCLFGIIRRSRKRRLIVEMIPSSGAHIGPRYNERLCEFVRTLWNIEVAAEQAPSLARGLERLASFCQNIIEPEGT